MTLVSILRRTVLAAVVSAVLLLAGLGALGLASAGGSKPLPETFRLAYPMGGDRGTYETTVGEGTGPRVFEWSAEQPFALRDGSYVAAHLRTTQWPENRGFATATVNGETTNVEHIATDFVWVASATGKVVGAAGGAGGYAGAWSTGLLLFEDSGTRAQVEQRTVWVDDPGCSLEQVLRSGVALDGPLDVPCVFGPVSFEATGVDTVRGVPAVRFEGHMGDDGVRLWFHESVPEALAVEHLDGANVTLREELVGFERGSGPWVAGTPLPPAAVLPPVQMAPREPWGPDDSGVAHAFPLSAAWQAAQLDAQEPRFRAFLETHADAHAVHAGYEEMVYGSSVERAWSFVVHGGDDKAILTVVQESTPPGGMLTDRLGVPNPGPGVPVARISSYIETDNPFGSPAMPEELPTVASLLALWEAFPGMQDSEDDAANAWGLDCFITCDEVGLVAGRVHIELPAGTPGSPTNATERSRFLLLDQDGLLLGSVDRHAEHTRSSTMLGSTQAPGSTIPPEEGDEDASAPVAGWVMPPGPEAAGLTIAAALAGIVTWLWPALKAGALGLFSRVSEDRLLEHPSRRRIVDAVAAQPGVHYQDLLRRTGLGHGTVEHHVRALVRAGLLQAVKARGYTCYFPAGATPQMRGSAGALKSAGARAVLEHVKGRPGSRAIDVAEATGLSQATVNHHVHRLADAGLVRVNRFGRELRLDVGPNAVAAGA